MKTLVIGIRHPLNDKRVIRTVKFFKNKGKVFYQYFQREFDEKICGSESLTQIPFIDKKYSKYRFINWYKKWINFYDRLLYWVDKFKPDLVYLHGLPDIKRSKVIYDIKKISNSKVIVDIHETYPLSISKDGNFSFYKILMKNYVKSLNCADGLVFLSNDHKNLFKKFNMNEEIKTYFFPNYGNSKYFSEDLQREKEIVFIGNSRKFSNFETSIVFGLKKNGFILKHVGNGFQSLFDLNLPNMSYLLMMKEISKSSFSLISFNDIINQEIIHPNKFYDSLAACVPPIVNKKYKSISDIVEKYKVGIIINEDLSPQKNVDCICNNYYNDYYNITNSIKHHISKFIWDKKKKEEFSNFIDDILY